MASDKMMSYGESKNTQQNKDFMSKLKSSLDNDGKIDTDEAKLLQESYAKILEQKNQILAISKEDLQKLANGLGIEGSSLGAVLRKLREKSSEVQTSKDEPAVQGLVGQSVDPTKTNIEQKPPVIEGLEGQSVIPVPPVIEGLEGQSVIPVPPVIEGLEGQSVIPVPPVIEGLETPEEEIPEEEIPEEEIPEEK